MLAMAFDEIETNGKKVTKTCYLLQEGSESPLMKERLLELAKFAEKSKPVFSAAGFYIVNQTTLTSMFKTTINYMVVLIQTIFALKV